MILFVAHSIERAVCLLSGAYELGYIDFLDVSEGLHSHVFKPTVLSGIGYVRNTTTSLSRAETAINDQRWYHKWYTVRLSRKLKCMCSI